MGWDEGGGGDRFTWDVGGEVYMESFSVLEVFIIYS